MNTVTVKKRIKLMMSLFLAGVLVLIIRLAWIQFVRGSEYSKLAAEQQTRDSVITAKRGSIYDRNMKVLAQSASAERVTINPNQIAKSGNAEKVIKALVDILGADEERVREQLKRTERQSVVIAKQVEKSTADLLRSKNIQVFILKRIRNVITPTALSQRRLLDLPEVIIKDLRDWKTYLIHSFAELTGELLQLRTLQTMKCRTNMKIISRHRTVRELS